MLKVLQLSDLHLFPREGDGAGWCDAHEDLDTARTLSTVLSEIQRRGVDYDLCVVTGDIAQQASEETYRRFARLMDGVSTPIYCLPGNHDDVRIMRGVMPMGRVSAPGFAMRDGWLLAFLDSSLPDEEPSGRLSASELKRLADLLEQHPRHQVMLFVHHQPIDVGSAWLDKIGLLNREALFDAIRGRDTVRAIVFGHVHQAFDRLENGVRLLGTPSTCIQFEPGRETFGYGAPTPAWRELTLHPNGAIETSVGWATGIVM